MTVPSPVSVAAFMFVVAGLSRDRHPKATESKMFSFWLLKEKISWLLMLWEEG